MTGLRGEFFVTSGDGIWKRRLDAAESEAEISIETLGEEEEGAESSAASEVAPAGTDRPSTDEQDAAAAVIQAGDRGHTAAVAAPDGAVAVVAEATDAAPAGNELTTSDDEDAAAAQVIQAGFAAAIANREAGATTTATATSTEPAEVAPEATPEQDAAAAVIQAGFQGHLSRESGEAAGSAAEGVAVNGDAAPQATPEQEAAASVIQDSYRSHLDRSDRSDGAAAELLEDPEAQPAATTDGTEGDAAAQCGGKGTDGTAGEPAPVA